MEFRRPTTARVRSLLRQALTTVLRCIMRARSQLWPVALTLLVAPNAHALVAGQAPAVLTVDRVFGDGVMVGNTLMSDDGLVNFALLPGGNTATIGLSSMPADADVKRAFVFWAASVDAASGIDRDIDLELPDGTSFAGLSVDFAEAGESLSSLNGCSSINVAIAGSVVPMMACRREITTLLQQAGPGGAVGTYRVSGVAASPGDCVLSPATCQSKFAAFAVAVAYESPTESVRRDVVIADAFLALDERGTTFAAFSSGIANTALGGFVATQSPSAQLTIVGYEGDASLGVPPQNQASNALRCVDGRCEDSVAVFTSSRPQLVPLSNGSNPAGNLMNGTNWSGEIHSGFDIDTFAIGSDGLGVIGSGDTSLNLRAASGDGAADDGSGGSGELFLLGPSLLSVETDAPSFDNAGTALRVLQSEAGASDVLTYVLSVQNDGTADARNVTLRDVLPSGVTYVTGSTTNTCGVASGDVNGVGPLQRAVGLNVATVSVGESCEVRFSARINANVSVGTTISNTATLDADDMPTRNLGPALTTVTAPAFDRPLKSVVVVGGGEPSPGAVLSYTLTLRNAGATAANGAQLIDEVPTTLDNIQVIAIPVGAVDASDLAQNRVQVDNINIPAGASVTVTITGRIRAATPTLTAIANQARLLHPTLAQPLLSDDPAVNVTANDPTVVVVASGVSLLGSQKTLVDENGGMLAPGDSVLFRIRVNKTGASATVVTVDDSLPEHVVGCTVVSTPVAGFLNCVPGGANGTGRLTGAFAVAGVTSGEFVVRTTIAADVPDGFVLSNTARLAPTTDAALLVDVASAPVAVVARPIFDASQKTAVDENGGELRPGDVVAYTISVQNTGTIPAIGASVVDVLDARLTLVELPDGGSSTNNPAGTALRFSLPTLAVGQTSTVRVRARVNSGVDNGSVISNTATVTPGGVGSAFTTPPANMTVTAAPLLVLEKTVVDDTGAPTVPGERVRYLLRVRNLGDGAARDINIADVVDARFASIEDLSGGVFDGTTWRVSGAAVPLLANLPPSSAVTVSFAATLQRELPVGTVIDNQATLAAAGIATIRSDDPATAALADATRLTVTSTPLLQLQKSATDVDGPPLLPGDTVRFAIAVTNVGNAPAADAAVTDALDSRFTLLSASDGGALSGNQVVFPAFALATGAAATRTLFIDARINAGVADGTVIDNQARVQATGAVAVLSDDPSTAAVGDATRVTVRSLPLLTLTKAVTALDPEGFEPGRRVRYTLVVSNRGSEAATNVQLVDVLPSPLTQVAVASPATLSAQTVTLSVASLAPQAARTITIDAVLARPLADGTVVDNQARVTSNELGALLSDDPATAVRDDSTRFIVNSPSSLSVTKSVLDENGAPVEPGDVLRYQITVRALGGRDATGVVVRDALSASLTDVVVAQGGTLNGNAAQWNIGTVPLDTTVTLSLVARLVAPLPNGTRLDNQAFVEADGVPTTPSDDPTTATPADATAVQVVAAADLSASTLEMLNETLQQVDTRRPAQPLLLRLRVRNIGRQVANNVRVLLPVPAELDVVNAAGGRQTGNDLAFDAATTPALATLANGEDVVLVVEARLATPLDNETPIRTQATVQADDVAAPFLSDDPHTATANDATEIRVVSAAQIAAFSKAVADDNGGVVEPADALTYTLQLSNTGDAIARGLVLRDVLPTGVTFVSASGAAEFQRTVVFDAVDVAPGQTLTRTVVVRVDADVASGRLLANQAEAALPGVVVRSDDVATPAVADPTVVEVVGVPRLALSKRIDGPTRNAPGDVVTYVLRVVANGTAAATGVVLRDALPPEVTLVEADAALGGAGAELVSVPFDLAQGDAREFVVRVRVNDVADLTTVANQASAVAQDVAVVRSDDPNTAAVEDATTFIVDNTAQLRFEKRIVDDNGPPLLAGEAVTFALTIANAGPGIAHDVVITDDIDPRFVDLTADNAAISNGRLTFSSPQVQALATMPRGTEVQLQVHARVAASVADGTVLANQATAATREGLLALSDDPQTAAAADATVVTVLAPNLVLEKTAVDDNGGSLSPSDAFTYVLTLRNVGHAAANGVVVTDRVPSELLDVEALDGGALGNGPDNGLVRFAVGQLPGQQSQVLRIRARVADDAPDGLVLSNQAEAAAAGVPTLLSDDPNTAAVRDPTVLRVSSEERWTAGLTLLRADGQTPLVGSVIGDERVVVRWTLRNSGTRIARDVRVRLPLTSLVRAETALAGIVGADGVVFDSASLPALSRLAPGDAVQAELTLALASLLPDNVNVPLPLFAQAATSSAESLVASANLHTRSVGDLRTSPLVLRDVDGGDLEPGDVLALELAVTNAGGAPAHDVVVQALVPPGTEAIDGTLRVSGAPVAPTASLVAGLAVGDIAPGEVVPVSMQMRLGIDVPRGHVVTAQADLAFDEEGGRTHQASDDPSTPLILSDATRLVVGGGTALVFAASSATPTATLAAPLTLTFVVANVGNTAAPIHITNAIPAGTRFRTGSMRVDGVPMTDAPDRDVASSDGAAVVLQQALAGHRELSLSFDLDVVDAEATEVVTQATLTSIDGDLASDADVAAPGAQALHIPIEARAALSIDENTLALSDENGGRLQADERIVVQAVLHNRATVPLRLTRLEFALSSNLLLAGDDSIPREFEAGDFVPDADDNIVRLARADGLLLAPGARRPLTFVVRVADVARVGDVVRVLGSAQVRSADGALFAPVNVGRATLTIGVAAGGAGLFGDVFVDGKSPSASGIEDTDVALEGATVLAFAVDGTKPIASAAVDARGRFRFDALPRSTARVEVIGTSGARFASQAVAPLQNGEVRRLDVPVLPTGSLYDASSFEPVGGTVSLLVDDGDDNPRNDRPLAALALGPGQQHQHVGADGYFHFDAPPGRYRLAVMPDAVDRIFPSLRTPVLPATDGNALGERFSATEPVQLTTQARPANGAPAPYYLRFVVTRAGPLPSLNHVPIDALQSEVSVTKSASHKRVSVGDIISYTVHIDNAAASGINLQAGGIDIVDQLPAGFRLIDGAVRMERTERSARGERVTQAMPLRVTGNSDMHMGPFPLLGRASYDIRYDVVVGPGTPPGQHDNTAVVRMAQGHRALAPAAIARVEVVEDAVFDLGTLRAKVFCDDNGNGFADGTEEGIGGVRVYSDVGSYADTDGLGRVHFTSLRPGMHVVKLDARTLPPLATTTTPQRTFYISAGLPAQVAIGVSCNEVMRSDVVITQPNRDVATADARIHYEGTVDPPTLVRSASSKRLDVALPRMSVGMTRIAGERAEPLSLQFDGERLERVLIEPRVAAFAVRAWHLTVRDSTDAVLYAFMGKGPPPGRIAFDGTDDEGRFVLRGPGAYRLLLDVVFDGGVRSSAETAFSVVGASPAAALSGFVMDETEGALFDDAGAPTLRLLSALGAWLDAVAADVVPVVAVHADASAQARSLTDTRAAALKAALFARGATPIKDVLSLADAQPLVPNLRDRDRQRNRRVEAFVPTATPAVAVHGPSVTLDGQGVAIDAHGKFNATLQNDPAAHELVLRTEGQTWRVAALAQSPVDTRDHVDGGTTEVRFDPAADRLQVAGVARDVGPLLALRVRPTLSASGAYHFSLVNPLPSTARWELRVVERTAGQDAVLWSKSAAGAPPTHIEWDGVCSNGAPCVTAAALARLIVTLHSGETAVSPDVMIDRQALSELLLTDPTAVDGTLNETARAELRAFASKLSSSNVAHVDVLAHTDDNGPRLRQQLNTQRTADLVKSELVALGLPPLRIDAVGRGAEEPLVPNVGNRARRQNRRVSIVVQTQPTAYRELAGAVANGKPLVSPSDGVFVGQAPHVESRVISVEMIDDTGARASVQAQQDAAPFVALGAAAYATAARTTVAAVPVSTSTATAPVTAPKLNAEQLQVALPARVVRASRSLHVKGVTHPENRVRVLDRDVDVDPVTGSFATLVALPEGESNLDVTATDATGATGTVRTPVSVHSDGFFTLLLADAAVGQEGAALDEWRTTNSARFGGAFVYGRSVAYVNGHTTGSLLFRDYDLTLHLDTSRFEPNSWTRDVLDPDRFYPVYGDSSVEVLQGQNSPLPLHLSLRADASRLDVGAIKTDIAAGDFLKYARARPGAQLTFDRGWMGPLRLSDAEVSPPPSSDPFRTRATAFVGGGGEQRHARVELLGTGSAIYFLRHERLVEGSERVSLLVRDAVTGAEIGRKPLTRNVDYTMRYVEGRVFLKAPVSAFADASFVTNQNLGQVARANRQFLEVEYEHLDDNPLSGASAGAAVTQRLYNHVDVGGGYVYEGRLDGTPAYQLAGGQLRVFLDEGTYVQAEIAGSQSVDAGNFISLDGGLSYTALGQSLDATDQRIGRETYSAARQGLAYGVNGQLQMGHWFKRARDDVAIRAYGQQQDPGFFAGSNIVEQGQTKWGAIANVRAYDSGVWRARYDGVVSLVPQNPTVTEFRVLHREIATLRYEHTLVAPLTLSGEYGYGYTWDSGSFGTSAIASERSFHTNVVAVGVDWQVIKALRLSLKQEGVLTGDPQQITAWNDRLISHVALKFDVTPDVALLGGASVRWNGENQLQAGVSVALNERTRIYLNQRGTFQPQLDAPNMGWTTTSVLGAESQLSDGARAYGEYQLENAFSAQQSRAVAGIASSWRLPFGFALQLGYEHVVVLGGASTPTSAGTVAPAAFTDGAFYQAGGANGAGSFAMGEGSRDAVSAGVEWQRAEGVLASQRFELRYDNMSEARGGHDRAWLMSASSVALRFTPELSLLARYNYALAQDLARAAAEAQIEEGVVGVAFRPAHQDWFSLITKLSRRNEMRPLSLNTSADTYTAHAAAIEPIVELPFDVQLVEKLALKHASVSSAHSEASSALTALWINRINWHALSTLRRTGLSLPIPGDIDVGAEYRMLYGLTSHTVEHGPLLELQYAPKTQFRLGVGFNFTRFSDQELDRNNVDRGGFFVRAVGTY